ncbi:assimilatory sulfite reductase (NADPH) flavoprotein subunit [Bacillus sp. 179-C3.3 HS]|uniref:assimilatory sulfite reductase (NADPH) flavoprotein subunit n=1 Tax=Bacillus sp. 179-C3.3 HS TaxID=3232162 RepID=UPI0039A05E5F
MQLHVLNSPFSQEQADLLNQLLPTLTDQQKIWLTGYLSAQAALAGSEGAGQVPSAQASTQPVVNKDVTVLYGSQTGNSEGLAKKTAQQLEEKGFNVTLSSMTDFKPNSLKKINNLLLIVSTHGEGDPPDNAISFHEYVHSKRAPKLDHLSYSVLSLGDSSYEFFCQTGKEFDERLKELGGSRLFDRVDCDLDFDEPFSEWLQGVTQSLGEGQVSALPQGSTGENSAGASPYSRTNPFYAEVLENINLNGRGSNKETRHLELSLEGSGLVYEPGDSLGIYPTNDPALVDELITICGWDENEEVPVLKNGDTLPLKEALTSHFEITVLTKPLLQKIAQWTKSEALQTLLEEGNEDKLKAYIAGRDLLDAARDFGPFEGSATDFTTILRKIPARLYSIASSLKANEDEVHLTIGAVRYDAHGRTRHGVCSILCADRLEPGDKLPVYIQHNQNFKLPHDPDVPMIMVGPGTGIAPFRSFMQEREEIGANGKSWLFFGDQHFVTDFLYQTEWQKWLKDGVLTKMDVAFSRDTEEKVYVQHQMKKNSKELFEWLEQGAYVYICGDEKHMAHDVHNTLLSIIQEEGAMSKEKAESYLANLQQQKRYQRDVY